MYSNLSKSGMSTNIQIQEDFFLYFWFLWISNELIYIKSEVEGYLKFIANN